jgi:hypothetical protein
MNSITTTDVTKQISIPPKLINEKKLKEKDLNDTLNLSQNVEIIKTSPGLIDNSIITGIENIDSIFKVHKNTKNENEKLKIQSGNKLLFTESETNLNRNKDTSINVSNEKKKSEKHFIWKKIIGFAIILILFILLFISGGILAYKIF